MVQGIAVATGLRKRFDWTGVAVGGIVGGVGTGVSNLLETSGNPVFGRMAAANGIGSRASDATQTLAGLAGGLAGAGFRSAVTGTDFGDNVLAVLPDVIGNTIGNMAADRVVQAQAQARADQLARQQGIDDLKARSDRIITDARKAVDAFGAQKFTITPAKPLDLGIPTLTAAASDGGLAKTITASTVKNSVSSSSVMGRSFGKDPAFGSSLNVMDSNYMRLAAAAAKINDPGIQPVYPVETGAMAIFGGPLLTKAFSALSTIAGAKAVVGFSLGYGGAYVSGVKSKEGLVGAGFVGALAVPVGSIALERTTSILGRLSMGGSIAYGSGFSGELAGQSGDIYAGYKTKLDFGAANKAGFATAGAYLFGGEAAFTAARFTGGGVTTFIPEVTFSTSTSTLGFGLQKLFDAKLNPAAK